MIYILGGFNFRNPQLFSWIEERPSQQIERNEGTKGMTNQRPLNIWTEHSNWDNTVTLFLMYRVIRISCLLRAILAELRSRAMEEVSIALNKQEICITRYIRKRVTVLTLLLGKLWPPQYFITLQEYSNAVHKFNTYLLFASMKFSIAS